MFWHTKREDFINERISKTVDGLTDGDYTDKEICDFILDVKNKTLEYLRFRNTKLSNELEENINAIKKLESNE